MSKEHKYDRNGIRIDEHGRKVSRTGYEYNRISGTNEYKVRGPIDNFFILIHPFSLVVMALLASAIPYLPDGKLVKFHSSEKPGETISCYYNKGYNKGTGQADSIRVSQVPKRALDGIFSLRYPTTLNRKHYTPKDKEFGKLNSDYCT